MNFLILLMAAILAINVRCDQNPPELNPKEDIKTKVEESSKELKSKDGDTLESLPSNQSPQTHYNSVYMDQKATPVEVDIGYRSSDQYSGQQASGQYSGQVTHQQPITVYRPVDVTNSGYGADSASNQQQSSYVSEEQPVYGQKTYIRQAQVEEVVEQRQPESAAYQQPASGGSYGATSYGSSKPVSSPGISSTYSSPDVKIVSHTRTFMPIVYKKPPEQENTQTTEEEYEKAVQDRPGGSYAAEQEQLQQQNYDPEQQYSKQSTGYLSQTQSQDSYSGGGYRQPLQEEQQPEVKQSYGNGGEEGLRPQYTPIQAHVQVIEEKGEYQTEQKQGYSSPQHQSYGSRTHPRPQYKNYKPSGYKPTMIATPNAYMPPSPPLSSLVGPPPAVAQPYGGQKPDDSYVSQQQDQFQQQEQQRLQQQQQQSSYGAVVEQNYEPQSGGQLYANNGQNAGYVSRKPEDYSYSSDDNNEKDSSESYDNGGKKANYGSDEDNSYNNENSYNSGEIGGQKPIVDDRFRKEFQNPLNSIGPKYNTERGLAYQRGPQLGPQVLKAQDIEYGFIPLTEENLKQMAGYGPEGYGSGNYANNGGRGKPEAGFGGEGGSGYAGNGGGQRRPNFGKGDEYGGENIGLMFGRGNGEGPRGPAYGGGDEFRGPVNAPPKGPIGLSPYRKPAFERPSYKDAGQEAAGYLRDYRNMAKDQSEEEEEDLDNEDTDYVGAAYKGTGEGLPPGASYNPRDVGLDEAVVAQLNLPSPGVSPGYRGGLPLHSPPMLDIPYSGSGPFPTYNGLVPGMPLRARPRPRVPYSATGMGYRSQYGYRAAASEVNPQTSSNSNSNSLSNLLNLNLNPIKNFRSLMSYITGGIAG